MAVQYLLCAFTGRPFFVCVFFNIHLSMRNLSDILKVHFRLDYFPCRCGWATAVFFCPTKVTVPSSKNPEVRCILSIHRCKFHQNYGCTRDRQYLRVKMYNQEAGRFCYLDLLQLFSEYFSGSTDPFQLSDQSCHNHFFSSGMLSVLEPGFPFDGILKPFRNEADFQVLLWKLPWNQCKTYLQIPVP